MIDFEGAVNNIAISLFNSNSVNNNVEFKRVLFDVYITMLKQGFLCSESLTNEKLLSYTPYEYFPCDAHLVGSFYMTPAMLRIITKKYEQNVKLDISNDDKKQICNLSKLLPLTHEQANLYLINNNVIASEIAPEGIQYLINSVSNIHCKPVLMSIYPIDSSVKVERAKRNTKPSVYYFLPDVINKTKFNSHIESIKRQISRQSSYIGFSILTSICDSFPFKFNGKNIITVDFIRSILSARPEFKIIDDISCVTQEPSSSEFSSLLKQYLSNVGEISHNDAYNFFLRYFEYKKFKQGGYNKNADFGKTVKSKKDEKLQFSDIVDNIVPDYLLSVDDIIFVISNIEGIIVTEKNINFDGVDNSIYGVNESAWDAFFLSYCKSEREKNNAKYSISMRSAQEYFLNYISEQFKFYLNNDNGFFSVVDGYCCVNDENINYFNNRNSVYLKPNIDELNDSLGTKYVLLDEIKQKSLSNHDIYSEVFSEKWGKIESKNKEDPDFLFTNDDYVKDLTMVYVKSFYMHSLSLIEQQVSFSNKRIADCQKRRLFVHSFSKNDSTSKEFISALTKLDEREEYSLNKIAKLNTIRDAVLLSESYVESHKVLTEIDDIKSSRKSLRINPVALKAGFMLHEKIVQEGGKSLLSDIETWVNELIEHSWSGASGDSIIWKYARSNLSRYTSHPYHPFGLSDLD